MRRGLTLLPGLGVVSASHDQTLRVWTSTGECLATLCGHSAIIYRCCVLNFSDLLSIWMGNTQGWESSSVNQSKALLIFLASSAGQLRHLLASLHQQLKTTQPGYGRLMVQLCRALSIQVC